MCLLLKKLYFFSDKKTKEIVFKSINIIPKTLDYYFQLIKHR